MQWDCVGHAENFRLRIGGKSSRSTVALIGRVARPTINDIEVRQRGVELLDVVPVHARISETGREQPGRLRRQIKAASVCPTHDQRQAREWLSVKPELLEHDIKRGALSLVAPKLALNIERRGVGMLRDTCDFRWWDEKNYSALVDEPADEPRTRHADHLGPGSRYPDGPASFVALRNAITPNHGLALRPPCLVSTNQRLSIDTFVAQDCCDRLAERATVLANDYAGLAGVLPAPARHILRGMASGGRNQARICSVFAIRAHVDKGWCAGKTDKPCKLRDCDFGWSGHGGAHPWRGHGRDLSAAASRGIRDHPLTRTHMTFRGLSTVPVGLPRKQGCARCSRSVGAWSREPAQGWIPPKSAKPNCNDVRRRRQPIKGGVARPTFSTVADRWLPRRATSPGM